MSCTVVAISTDEILKISQAICNSLRNFNLSKPTHISYYVSLFRNLYN